MPLDDVVMTTMNKFHAKRTEGFQSGKEHKRYRELCLMEKAGLVSQIECQVRFDLAVWAIQDSPRGSIAKESVGHYVLDFQYWDKEKSAYIHEDVKGYKKGPAYDLFRLKKNLMKALFGIEVQEI